MKKFLSALVAASMLVSSFATVANADTATKITVDPSNTINKASESIFGANSDWTVNSENLVKDYNNNDFTPNILFKSALNGMKNPVIRLGEDASTKINWKDTIGDYSSRPDVTLWGYTGPIKFGLVEKIKYWQDMNPDVQFTFTINIHENANDIADLVEFLEGDASTTWGAKRIAAGLAEPVKIQAYQMGNEQDWGESLTAADYLALVKPLITAVKGKNASAKIAVLGGTSMYNEYLRSGKYNDEFLSGVVSDLKNTVDYVSFNWYMTWNRQDIMRELFKKVSDTLDSNGATNVKIFLSEVAGSHSGVLNEEPNSLWGTLEMADLYISALNNSRVGIVAYHGVYTGKWGQIWVNPNNNISGVTGNGLAYKAVSKYMGQDVVSTSVSGTDVTSTAMKADDGKVNLFIVNKSAGEKNAAISVVGGGYNLIKSTVITGSEGLYSINNAVKSLISSKEYSYDEGKDASAFTLPGYSICALELAPKAAKTVYSEDFSTDSLGSLQAVLNEGTAEIADGRLKLTDESFNENFIYLPSSLKEYNSYTLEADLTLGDDIGIVYGASSASNIVSSGSGHIIKVSSSEVSDESYSGGASSTVSAVSGLSLGNTVHAVLNISSDNIAFSINDSVIFTRANSGEGTGEIGFYFSYAEDTVDNIKVLVDSQKVKINTPFTYEESFDAIADGKLPAGYEIRNGYTNAWVENGKLHINTKKDWSNIGSVVINELGFVDKKNLTIEADITSGGYDSASWSSRGGFVYGLTNEGNGTAALGTWESTGRFVVMDSAEPSTIAKGEIGGSDFVTANKTVHFKAVFGNNEIQPEIYVDGVNYPASNTISSTSNAYGEIGLFSLGSEIIIDNLKITGDKAEFYAEGEYSEVLQDVSWTDDFESYTLGRGDWKKITNAVDNYGYANLGTQGAGWSIEQDGTGNKYIYLDCEYTDGPYVVTIPGLDVVQKNGLEMEADIWAYPGSKSPSGSHKYSGGFIYGWDGTSANYGTVSHSACQDTRVSIFDTASNAIDTNDFGFADTFQSNKGSKIHLRIQFTNPTKPNVYISDAAHEEVKVDIGNWMKTNTTEGLVGLYAYNAKICMDNLEIHAKQKKLVADTVVYDAAFNTANHVFVSVDDAIQAVKVTQIKNGVSSDVTDKAQITSERVGETSNYKIKVVYGDFTKILDCTVISKVNEAFIFEDDFESYTLGRGDWKKITNAVDTYGYTNLGNGGCGWSIEAEADGNKYIHLDVGNTDLPYVVTIPGLDVVQKNGLQMEADMWLAPGSADVSGGHKYSGGFIYGWDGTSANYGTVSHSACQDTRVSIFDTASNAIDTNDFGFADTFKSNKGSKIHLRIQFTNPTKPNVYISDAAHEEVKVDIGNWMKSNTTEGKVGIYATNAQICIDNLKISGVQYRDTTQDSELKISKTSYNGNSKTVNVSFSLVNAAKEKVQVYAAVYDENGALIGVNSVYSTVPENNVRYFGSVGVPVLGTYTDNCTVKLFAWNDATLRPAV